MKLTVRYACGKGATFLNPEEGALPEPPVKRTKAEKRGSKGWECPECPGKVIWTLEGAMIHIGNIHFRPPTQGEMTLLKERLISKEAYG